MAKGNGNCLNFYLCLCFYLCLYLFSTVKIQRTIPPAAAPVYMGDIIAGIKGFFFGQRQVKRFESELREYFGVKHIFLVSSGKAALTLILQALKSLKPDKKEVLIPAYTCYSVPSAIVKAELKISLSDIDPTTFDFDYKLLDESINENTLCVIPTHLFGISSDVDRINKLCRDRGVFVIEDAAQAMGEKFNGKLFGTIGDVGFFSLGRGKNITCGSGGIIITNSERIASAIEKEYSSLDDTRSAENIVEFFKIMVLALFIRPSLYWFPSGMAFLRLGETIFYKDFPIKKLSAMKAGIFKNWQRRLEESSRIRKGNSEDFCRRLGLQNSSDIAIPFLRLPLVTGSREKRDELYSISQKSGLGISRMYPQPVNEIEEIKDQFKGREFRAAKSISEMLLTIPVHPLLSANDKEKICDLFAGASDFLQKTEYFNINRSNMHIAN